MLRHVIHSVETRAAKASDPHMSSEDRFSHPGKIQPGDIYEVFREHEEPVLSTTDIDREIDWASRSTVRRQLVDMRESDELRSKKAGDQKNAGEVWYPSDKISDIPQPTPDPIKLLYRHPWFSLLSAGFFFVGFGFILFMPGYFGEGQYLGILDRDWLVLASFFLYFTGVVMVSIGSGRIIGKSIMSIYRNDH